MQFLTAAVPVPPTVADDGDELEQLLREIFLSFSCVSHVTAITAVRSGVASAVVEAAFRWSDSRRV
ncbi:hypothetical protein OSTOST_13949 [Ostertagia ostertagi]